MNELIEKLAKQAGFNEYINENLWPEEQPEFNNLMEKFAELIVRECGVALSPMLRDMVSRGQAYDLIKQHFGVTE